MIKFTAFAIGLLTVASIAPDAQALQANVYAPQSIANQQAQLSIVIGDRQPTYNGRYHQTREARRLELRRLELARERAAQRRSYRYNSRYNHGRGNGSNGYYGSNNGQVNEHRDRN